MARTTCAAARAARPLGAGRSARRGVSGDRHHIAARLSADAAHVWDDEQGRTAVEAAAEHSARQPECRA